MPRKSSPKASAAATEVAPIATPPPVTITAPNIPNLTEQYQVAVSPAVGFCVKDNASFLEAGERFNAVVAFIDFIETAFKASKALAYQTHKSITALEGQFLGPAMQAKQHLAAQQLNWRRQLDAQREAEERRIREEQQRLALEEHARQQAILDAEVEAQRVQLEIAQQDKMPWEYEEVVVERIVLPEPEIAAVRLPSNVPMAMGGPTVRNSPWMAKVDLKALVAAAAKDDSLLQYLEPKMPLLNAQAREHGECVGDIIPGVSAYREERLTRG